MTEMWHSQPSLPGDWHPPGDVNEPQDDSHNLCGLGVGDSTSTAFPERVGENEVCPVTSSGSDPANLSTEGKLPIICFQSQDLLPVD